MCREWTHKEVDTESEVRQEVDSGTYHGMDMKPFRILFLSGLMMRVNHLSCGVLHVWMDS